MTAHVLFVDDDEGLLRLATRALTRVGYRVSTAASTDSARTALLLELPEVIVVDYTLGTAETGLDFLRALRAAGIVLPAILCTGFADEARVIEALRSGVADIVPKSDGYLDYLPEAIERVLRETRVQRELAEAQRLSEREAHFRTLAEEREQLLASERAARTEAERASRVKDEFVATLSHELRTPLNAIVGWTQILMRDASEPERVKKGLEVIERNARAQAQMVDDLLDLSRVMAGKLRLDLERLDLGDIVEYVIRSVQPAADAKEIRITPILEPAGPVQGDPARLQQVVWNLLSNAIKFTGKRGKVEVLLRGVEGEVELTVSDTGQGIKPEFLAHVFERFRQEDTGTTRQHGGLGLGLSIAKQLVEMHCGRIEAMSDGEGRGATFVVRLPTANIEPVRVAGARSQSLETPPALAGLHVLIVEDEPDARELVERLLQERGATTTALDNAADALAAYEAAPPDVVVSDIGMPGEDGYEFIRKLRALEQAASERSGQSRTTPAAALTAFARSEDRRRALLAGFQTHIAKPVDPLELVVVIAALAGRTSALSD
ncbi:response regulator [Trinickia violacea]|uniref:Virulence sensor protein BvgS n=1 Tax=Trinickia violacea TaxID=2571746 RepID=A0A4P8IJZ1_9BURK|nr:response regulator [Trinickia violacea]QCP49148.1 response regulator [Trinickia violacea]